jgi:hypothetical protein
MWVGVYSETIPKAPHLIACEVALPVPSPWHYATLSNTAFLRQSQSLTLSVS